MLGRPWRKAFPKAGVEEGDRSEIKEFGKQSWWHMPVILALEGGGYMTSSPMSFLAKGQQPWLHEIVSKSLLLARLSSLVSVTARGITEWSFLVAFCGSDYSSYIL